MTSHVDPVDFDAYTDDYRAAVDRAVGFSGRDQSFYLQAKLDLIETIVKDHLGPLGVRQVLDVGSGIGLFERGLGRRGIDPIGIDVAAGPLLYARRSSARARYCVYDGATFPFHDGTFDLCFTACVLHHVPPARRHALVRETARVIRPGGLLVVFEHNPLNPLTRLAVSRCEFDRDAVLLGIREVRRLLESVRMTEVESGFFLLTPWSNGFWRVAERTLRRVPLGAQYFVVGRNPEGAGAAAPQG